MLPLCLGTLAYALYHILTKDSRLKAPTAYECIIFCKNKIAKNRARGAWSTNLVKRTHCKLPVGYRFRIIPPCRLGFVC